MLKILCKKCKKHYCNGEITTRCNKCKKEYQNQCEGVLNNIFNKVK